MKYFLAPFFRFFEDFLSLWKVRRMRKKHDTDLQEYFFKIEKDINSVFQEIKKEYERK